MTPEMEERLRGYLTEFHYAAGIGVPLKELRALLNTLDAERRQVEKLERLLKDCADNLEEEIQSRHPAHADANYERDMVPVYRARAALEEPQS